MLARGPLVSALVVAVLSLSTVSVAATTPSGELRAFFADATLVLTDPENDGKYAEQFAAIRTLTRQVFDVREASKLALGPVWDQRTPAERDQFEVLYADFLERAFIGWIASRVQIAGGPRVTFLAESIEGSRATVRTTVLGRNGHDLPLDYRMAARGDRWAVRDVVIDGVSLSANYRAQFTRVIQASSYPDLVRQLQEKVSGPPPVVVAGAERTDRTPAEPPAPSVTARATPDTRTSDDRVESPRARTEPAVQPAPARSAAASLPKVETPRAPEAPLATPTVAAARPRAYWVQVAAFKSVEAAMHLASLLRRDRPAPEKLAIVTEPGPTLTRVRIGPFADRAEAALKLRSLESRGYKPFIAEDGGAR